MPFPYIREQGKAGHLGERLLAVVLEGRKGRVYLSPTSEMVEVARQAKPLGVPESSLPKKALGFRIQEYGMSKYRDLFSARQLVALTTFSDLVLEAREMVIRDAKIAGMANDGVGLDAGGTGATAYGETLAIYLAFIIDQVANHSSTVCGWNSTNTQMRSVFARQAISMTWDYAESNPFCSSSGSYNNLYERMIKGFVALGSGTPGTAEQADAATQQLSEGKIISTDPPYYDNIGYADLSDFFYVWMRRSLKSIYPSLFGTMVVPEAGRACGDSVPSWWEGGCRNVFHQRDDRRDS